MNWLAEGYKLRKHRTTEGVASTGEISPKGTVSHVEDWEGRIAAEAAPGGLHWGYSVSTGLYRPLTFKELVEKGYFIIGKGPQNHVNKN